MSSFPKCPSCGFRLGTPKVRFCMKCGTNVEHIEVPSGTSPPSGISSPPRFRPELPPRDRAKTEASPFSHNSKSNNNSEDLISAPPMPRITKPLPSPQRSPSLPLPNPQTNSLSPPPQTNRQPSPSSTLPTRKLSFDVTSSNPSESISTKGTLQVVKPIRRGSQPPPFTRPIGTNKSPPLSPSSTLELGQVQKQLEKAIDDGNEEEAANLARILTKLKKEGKEENDTKEENKEGKEGKEIVENSNEIEKKESNEKEGSWTATAKKRWRRSLDFIKRPVEKIEKAEKERSLYSDFSQRLQSFSSQTENGVVWPHTEPSAEKMAEAGFIFVPKGKLLDRVKCYYCGVKFSNWLYADDPRGEHRKWKPNCKEVLSWEDSSVNQTSTSSIASGRKTIVQT